MPITAMPDRPAENLPILYQDEHLVVINKPSGLLVHRSMIDRHETRFALQILRDQLGQYVYPLHRLDKPTSGALAFALSPEIAKLMGPQFANKSGQLEKRYLAVVRGYAPETIIVDHPLKEELDKIADKKARTDKMPQAAISEFRCLATIEIEAEIERYPQSRYSLIDCLPRTGRKHQLRRHCKHMSHPIIGDAKHGRGRHNRYFKTQLNTGRLLLHAYKLSFSHPLNKSTVSCVAPLDDTMLDLFQRFLWLENLPHELKAHHAN